MEYFGFLQTYFTKTPQISCSTFSTSDRPFVDNSTKDSRKIWQFHGDKTCRPDWFVNLGRNLGGHYQLYCERSMYMPMPQRVFGSNHSRVGFVLGPLFPVFGLLISETVQHLTTTFKSHVQYSYISCIIFPYWRKLFIQTHYFQKNSEMPESNE